MLRVLTFVICLCAAPFARAHPHVFVEVGLGFETNDDGQIVAVEVTWSYDALFSLLVLSDRGLDPDGDMILTQEERALLKGFDLSDWPEGFEGALFLYHGAAPVTLGPAEAVDARIVNGAIVTRHRRAVTPVVLAPGETLTVRPYDPYYYAALNLTDAGALPAGCAGLVTRADAAAADKIVDGLGAFENERIFEEIKVGIHYADALEVTCAGS